jgi:hypothetical protein
VGHWSGRCRIITVHVWLFRRRTPARVWTCMQSGKLHPERITWLDIQSSVGPYESFQFRKISRIKSIFFLYTYALLYGWRMLPVPPSSHSKISDARCMPNSTTSERSLSFSTINLHPSSPVRFQTFTYISKYIYSFSLWLAWYWLGNLHVVSSYTLFISTAQFYLVRLCPRACFLSFGSDQWCRSVLTLLWNTV